MIPIPGKSGLPKCQEQGKQREMKEREIFFAL